MRQSEYDARKKEEEAQERSRARAERRYETRQAAARRSTRSAGRGPINRSTAIHPGGTVVMVGGRELVLPAGSTLTMVGGKVTSFSLPGKQQEYEARRAAAERVKRMYEMSLITRDEARLLLEDWQR
jgi:hypothetical protein